MAIHPRHTRQLRQRLVSLPVGLASALLLAGCGTDLGPADGHSTPHLNEPAASTSPDSAIPAIVNPVPLVPAPSATAEPELYTVVAQDVPIRDLLFNMARDAAINVDVHPDVTGVITLNAIDQSLPQILERISRQGNIRWHFDETGNLVVEPDSPYWVSYDVDYVNVQRSAATSSDISTAIVSNVAAAGGGGGGGQAGGARNNNSTSNMTQTSTNNFWATLTANLTALLSSSGAVEGNNAADNTNIVTNSESGIITVRATAAQHQQIAAFIHNVEARSLYQVLIEATVVEVTLNDQFQSGVDWATLSRNSGEINFVQSALSPDVATSTPTNVLTIDRSSSPDAITATIAMLSQFGELRVLSSPKIMALNNQSAMLRVVDNTIYFTIDVQPGVPGTNTTAPTPPVYTSTVNTVPVGFVMTVTPQIGTDDQVTLNVRPTISRIVRFVNDPNPILAEAGVTNAVPEIQVRELESVLKVYSGQIAILGGLMQDSLKKDVDGLPGVSRLPGVRNLFSYRDETATKTELIVFIRPVVVRQPSLNGDLKDYREYLPSATLEEDSAAINTGLLPSVLSAQPE